MSICLIFPRRLLHEKDGGRYIGTGHLVITKDPDSDWVNVGTYRIMSQDKDTPSIYIGPGKHAFIHKQKYFEKNQAMPVNVVLGSDPLDWFAASWPVPAGVSEFDLRRRFAWQPDQSHPQRHHRPALSRRCGDRPGRRDPTRRTERRRSVWRMARLLCQSAQSLEPFIRVKRILASQQSDHLLRQSGAPAAHPDAVTRDHALRACLGRNGESRRARRFRASGRTSPDRGSSPSSPSSSAIPAMSNKPA